MRLTRAPRGLHGHNRLHCLHAERCGDPWWRNTGRHVVVCTSSFAAKRQSLVNDNDPKPLYYQFKAELVQAFEWDYLESGPEVWKVRIARPAN